MPYESNTWIFQGSPKIWNVAAAVASLSQIDWVVRQHKGEIVPGDRVFIWESGDNAGIVAVARVILPPMSIEDSPEELKFYPDGHHPTFKVSSSGFCLK